MKLKQAFEILHESKEFKNWFKKNKNSSISHAFTMKEKNILSNWEIGYADKSQKVTVFEIHDEKIKIRPPEETFKKPKTKIHGLNLSNINSTLDDALEIAQNLQKEKYPSHIPMKIVIIVQTVDCGQIWNLTFVTTSFNVLNIKISTETKEVLEDKLVSLIQT